MSTVIASTLQAANGTVAQADTPAEQERIIAALCAGAPNDVVRNCLRKYSPQKQAWQIEAAFKQDKKGPLVETLTYLGVPDMDQYRADALPHELICRIQNLLPDECHICNNIYCVKLTDKPIASCVRCGQGCHNQCFLQALGKSQEELDESNNFGASILNPYATLGLHYVCGHCRDEVIPPKENLKVKNKGRPTAAVQRQSQGASSSSAQSEVATQSVPVVEQDHQTSDDAAENSQHQTSDDAAENSQHETSDDAADNSQQNSQRNQLTNQGPPASVARRQQRVARQNNAQPTANRQNNAGREPDVCRFYRQGRCKHGFSGKKEGNCQYGHPKLCRKFLTNGNQQRRGCTLGAQCQFLHPKMCRSSLRERRCYREDCTYMHIKGTKRPESPTGGTRNPPARQDVSSGNTASQHTAPPRNSARHQPPSDSTFLDELKNLSEQMRLIGSKIHQLEANQGLIMQRHMFSYPQTKIAQPPSVQMLPYPQQPQMVPAPQYQPNTYMQRNPPLPQPSQ